MVERPRGSLPSSLEEYIRNATKNVELVSAALSAALPGSEIDDDRFGRGLEAKGVTTINHQTLQDGNMGKEYFRADSSQIELGDPNNYGSDDPLTPYTDVQGSA